MQFNDLGLAKPVLRALNDEGYETPTPIQGKAIPAILDGKDILGIAQTGTGKTAAFALPILTHLANNPLALQKKGARVLVLSPTRELASQIADSFRTYARHMKVSVAVIFGGVPHRKQSHKMSRGVDVLVATPGRLIDHLNEGTVNLSNTEIMVLDEADQMLDMGFVKPIRQIVAKLPNKKQNIFLSATMPRQIASLASELLKDPVKVTVAPISSPAERVEQKIILIERAKKRSLLLKLFSENDFTRTVVFTRTKRGADRVAKTLETGGIPAAAIHGNKSQSQREAALNAFRKSRINVLVATDIAARGIDIDDVSHVINFELPEMPEAYVHRIGRTARAGKSGTAISFCDISERDFLRGIERLTKQKIPSEDCRKDDELEADKRPERAPMRNHQSKPSRRRPANGRSAPKRTEGKNGGTQEQENRRAKPSRPNRSRSQAGNNGQPRKPSRRRKRAAPANS